MGVVLILGFANLVGVFYSFNYPLAIEHSFRTELAWVWVTLSPQKQSVISKNKKERERNGICSK
jgi:hypothetical protein